MRPAHREMLEFVKDYWPPALIVFGVLAVAFWAVTNAIEMIITALIDLGS